MQARRANRCDVFDVGSTATLISPDQVRVPCDPHREAVTAISPTCLHVWVKQDIRFPHPEGCQRLPKISLINFGPCLEQRAGISNLRCDVFDVRIYGNADIAGPITGSHAIPTAKRSQPNSPTCLHVEMGWDIRFPRTLKGCQHSLEISLINLDSCLDQELPQFVRRRPLAMMLVLGGDILPEAR